MRGKVVGIHSIWMVLLIQSVLVISQNQHDSKYEALQKPVEHHEQLKKKMAQFGFELQGVVPETKNEADELYRQVQAVNENPNIDPTQKKKLDLKSQEKFIEQNPNALVLYLQPGCKFCEEFEEEEFQNFNRNVQAITELRIPVGVYVCDQGDFEILEFCEQNQDINGFPHVEFYFYTTKVIYQGQMTGEHIGDWIDMKLKPKYQEVAGLKDLQATFNDFKASTNITTTLFIFIGDLDKKSNNSIVFKTMAHVWSESDSHKWAVSNNSNVKKQYGVDKPDETAILAFKISGGNAIKSFQGAFENYQDVMIWWRRSASLIYNELTLENLAMIFYTPKMVLFCIGVDHPDSQLLVEFKKLASANLKEKTGFNFAYTIFKDTAMSEADYLVRRVLGIEGNKNFQAILEGPEENLDEITNQDVDNLGLYKKYLYKDTLPRHEEFKGMDEFANDYYEDMMDWLYEFRRNKLRPHKKTDLTNETEIAALSHNNVQYKKFKDFKDLTGDPAYKHKLILLLGYGNNSSCGQICKTALEVQHGLGNIEVADPTDSEGVTSIFNDVVFVKNNLYRNEFEAEFVGNPQFVLMVAGSDRRIYYRGDLILEDMAYWLYDLTLKILKVNVVMDDKTKRQNVDKAIQLSMKLRGDNLGEKIDLQAMRKIY